MKAITMMGLDVDILTRPDNEGWVQCRRPDGSKREYLLAQLRGVDLVGVDMLPESKDMHEKA